MVTKTPRTMIPNSRINLAQVGVPLHVRQMGQIENRLRLKPAQADKLMRLATDKRRLQETRIWAITQLEAIGYNQDQDPEFSIPGIKKRLTNEVDETQERGIEMDEP